MAEKGLYFRNQRIIILGVNKLTRSLLKSLSRGYFKTVLLGNRSHPQAKLMADRYGAEAFGLEELPRLISNCDVVVSATSAPHLILRSEDVPFCGPNLFFDLAVPRDLDPQLGNRPGDGALGCESFGAGRTKKPPGTTFIHPGSSKHS
jgi:glutamyl-tRNA reductase